MSREELKSWMQRFKKKPVHIAAATGLNPETIKRYLNGQTNPSVGTITLIENYVRDTTHSAGGSKAAG